MPQIGYIGNTDTLYILTKLKNVMTNGYVAKEEGKGLSTNDFTTELMNNLIANNTKLADITEGATKTLYTRVIDDGTKIGVIEINGVKTDIYIPKIDMDSAMSDTSINPVKNNVIKKYVDDAVGAVVGIKFELVDALPATGKNGIIYFVPKSGGAGTDIKDEYVWIESESRFEKIGSTDIDLSGYVKTTDLVEISTEDIDAMFNNVWNS